MSEPDLDRLRNQYRDWATADLVRIVADSESYRPDAVSVVREILAARDPTEVAALTDEADAEQRHREATASEPLGWGSKAACLIFCGLPGIVIAVLHESQGKTQKARDAWRWVVYGWVTWITIGFLFSL